MVTNNTCSTCLSHICIGWQNIQNWQDILTDGMIWGNQRKHGHYATMLRCVLLGHAAHTLGRGVSSPSPPFFTQGPRRAQCNQVDCSHPQLRTVGSHRRPPDDSALRRHVTRCQRCIPEMWVAVSIPEHNIDFK